ncbi:LURP-one-related/scramblase family protein [Robertmurraya siralis]|uniref:hypothetical protein n=1 Tax=Robertmurraya siralis TaxID=77777 RepID=UPI0010F7654C|nr:hypothetical protein [Robertmurraya siralis]
MSIQQYYRFAAITYLNGSIAALIPVMIVVIPLSILSHGKEVVWTALPFILYSLVSYQSYLLNHDRSLEIDKSVPEDDNLSLRSKDKYLLMFMPAPSLRMLLFSPKGAILGEIRDARYLKLRWFLPYFLDRFIPAEYGLYNVNNELVMKVQWKRDRANVYDSNGDLRVKIEEQERNKYNIQFFDQAFSIIVQSERLFTDIQFKNTNKETIGRVRKGWMPLEWDAFFKDANTPVLSFDDDLSEEERSIVLALLVKIYRYRNH